MSKTSVQQIRKDESPINGEIATSPGESPARCLPILTIGMPVYNGGRWLAETLESLLGQTFRDFILVVSDNCSTDNTRQICEQFAQADPRVRYHRQSSNIGVFRNYDAVFEGVKTDYFKWASSNDLCKPRFLELCIEALDRDPSAVMACTQTMLFDSDAGVEELYKENIDWTLEDPISRYTNFWSNIGLNNMMNGVIRVRYLRRTLLNRVYQGSDLNMIAELLLQGRAVFVDEPLFWRRMSPEASSASKTKDHHDSFFENEPVQAVRGQLAKQLMFGVVGAFRSSPGPWTKCRAAGAALRRLIRNRRRVTREIFELCRGDDLKKASR